MTTRRVAVLFDGDCGLCQRTVRTLRRLDLLRRLEFYDVSREWGEIQKRFPRLEQAACLEEMHVIRADGGVATGFDGYREIAKQVPLGWLFLPVLYLPGVRKAGQAVYRRVAGNRARGTCPPHSDPAEKPPTAR